MENVYLATYCECIYESSYATLSIHKTKKGANEAIKYHKEYIKKEYKKLYKKDVMLPFGLGSWKNMKGWRVIKMKIEK